MEDSMSEKVQGKKVAILATDGFEESELLEPKRMLEEAGIQTTRRDPKDDPEGTAFAVAWSAVEKKYEKRTGRWVQKD